MQVQAVDNVSFNGVKNTFLNKAKLYGGVINKRYYQSLHHEAKARLAYMNYEKASHELTDMDFDWSPKSFAKAAKLMFKMVNNKIKSSDHMTLAHQKLPERFWQPDVFDVYPERHYKLPASYIPKVKI